MTSFAFVLICVYISRPSPCSQKSCSSYSVPPFCWYPVMLPYPVSSNNPNFFRFFHFSTCFKECSSSDDDQEGYAEIHADPDNCGAYYECAHGVAYEELCPDGLLYNTLLQVCDYAKNVDCGTRPVTPTPFTDSTDY